MRTLGVLAACVSLVMGAATLTSSVASASTPGAISGTISYQATGVGGVCVSVSSSDGGVGSGSATTAGDGTYTISGLAPDSYNMTVDPTCYQTVTSLYASQTLSSIAVSTSTTTTQNDSLALGGSIGGTVSYLGTGEVGICVETSLSGGGGIVSIATTASNGTYTIDGLVAGTYDVDVDPTCYGTVSTSPYASQNLSSIAVSASTTTTEDDSLALGVSITGTITYQGTGVEGVCVNVYANSGSGKESTAKTAIDGTYTLSSLAAGTYDVDIDPTCYQTVTSIYASHALTTITVSAGTTTTENDAMTLGGVITGTMSYQGSGVAGVCVEASRTSGGGIVSTATTASNGTYTIDGLVAGTYDVDIDPTCYESVSSPYAYLTLSSIPISAGVTTTENYALTLVVSMSGTISYQGLGVGGVCVDAALSGGGESTTTTASDGSYSFSGLAAGSYSVNVDPACNGSVTSPYEGQTLSPITISQGATTTENDSLVIGGVIAGIVTYDGVGVGGVCVNVYSNDDGGYAQSVFTASDGAYSFSGLPADSNGAVHIDPTCGDSVATGYAIQTLSPITISEGATTTANASLTLAVSITGIVSYHGTGVGGVCVDASLSSGGGVVSTATTGSDGTYTIDGLVAGSYSLSVDPTCNGSVTSPYEIQTLSRITISESATTTANDSLTLVVSITGIVSYHGTGVGGVCVGATLSGGGGVVSTATTGSDGSYSFSGLAAGSYSVYVDPTCNASVSSIYASQTVDSIAVSVGATTTANVTLALAKVAQSSLTLTSVSGTVGTALSLSASGGSGTGALGYVVDSAGSAGCTLSGTALSASSAGTCTVTVSRAGDATYLSVSSATTTVAFTSPSSGVAGAGGGAGGGTGTSNAPPPSILAASSYGSPTSGQTSSSGPTTLTATLGGATTSITVPTGALPSGTTLSVYPITDNSSLGADVPPGQSYVAAFAVSWQTTGGTSPSATSPITMTITDPSIAKGDSVYVLTPSGLVVVGTATANGTITFTFTSDPVFLVTTGAEVQAPLSLATTSGVLGKPLNLATSGGSGNGTITFSATNGTAKGCAIVDGALTARSAGTCLVSVTKSGDATYGSASSSATSVALVLPRRPSTIAARFAGVSSRLTARDQRVIAGLSKKLLAGATVIVTGYAKANANLARARARAVSNYLKAHVKVHVVLKYSTLRNGATVVTRSQ